MIALILSILIPGLGQLYYGKNGRGILMIVLGITPLYFVSLTWSIIDIILLNKKGTVPFYKPREAVWGIAGLVFIIPIFLGITAFGIFSFGRWYSDKYVYPQKTLREIGQISSAIDDFQSTYGKYPSSIHEIINNPIRNDWLKDSWGQPYHYKVCADGTGYTLISSGKDLRLNTHDDMMFRNEFNKKYIGEDM